MASPEFDREARRSLAINGGSLDIDQEWLAFFALDYPTDARSPTLVERDPEAHPYIATREEAAVPELPERGAAVLRFALERWAALHPAEARAEEARLRRLTCGRRITMRVPRSALLASTLAVQRWWKRIFYHPSNFRKFGVWIEGKGAG